MTQEIIVFTILYQDSTEIYCFNQLYCLDSWLFGGTPCVFRTLLFSYTMASACLEKAQYKEGKIGRIGHDQTSAG